MKNKTLFLITSNFPFGNSEAFLENEYPHLADAFEDVIIISNDLKETKLRGIQKNTSVKRIPYFPSFFEKLLSIRYLFYKTVIQELKYLYGYKLSIFKNGILNTILVSYASGQRLSNFIQSLAKEKKISYEDVTVYSYWCNDMATGLVILKEKYPELKAICRSHGYDLYFERSEIGYLPFRKFIYKTVDYALFISQQGLNYAIKKFGDFNSFHLSYLGTQPPNFRLANVGRSPFLIVSCGRCVPIKRIDRLINALSKLKNNHMVRWIHFGDGILLKKLKLLAKEKLHQNMNIEYEFFGNIPNEELIKKYQLLSPALLVNTSESEGLPVTMMEAMSIGIPVMSYDVGGVSEIVKNGINGYLLKDDSIISLAKSLTDFMELNKEQLNKLSLNAVKTWENQFNATKNYPQLLKLLK